MTSKINSTGAMFKIVFRSIKIYILNFSKFVGYMSFPTLGVFLGIFAILGITLGIEEHFLVSSSINSAGNLLLGMLILVVATIPGFLILCKAFFDYIIAMVALCRAGCDLVATDSLVNDLKSYNSIVDYREIQYTFLIFILSFAYTILFSPFLFVLGIVFFVYTGLSIQAFAQDDRLSAIDAIKRSFMVIPGHVANTIILYLVLGILTYLIIPNIFIWIFDASGFLAYLNKPVELFLTKLPLEDIIVVPLNALSTSIPINFNITVNELIKMLAENITKGSIATIIIMYMLPLRAIACTLWYDSLNNSNSHSSKYAKKLAKKAAEEF